MYHELRSKSRTNSKADRKESATNDKYSTKYIKRQNLQNTDSDV